MTWGNRLFWGVMFFIGIHFLWLGAAIEHFVPIWIATIIGIAFMFWILKYGFRPNHKEEIEEKRG